MATPTKVSIASLLEAGAHFGHQTRRWNPKMKPYIFGSRGDIYIIDLKQTLVALDRTYSFVQNLASRGGTVLFVGTKKQAQEVVADAANRCGMPYVNNRWLGGMLTNFVTIRQRVVYMEELEAQEADGRMALLPKKEQILKRKRARQAAGQPQRRAQHGEAPRRGVHRRHLPRRDRPVHEARRLNLPIIGTLDTNCDPDDVDYGIPANDDAIRSVSLLCNFVADAVLAGGVAGVTEAEMASGADAAAPAEQADPQHSDILSDSEAKRDGKTMDGKEAEASAVDQQEAIAEAVESEGVKVSEVPSVQ